MVYGGEKQGEKLLMWEIIFSENVSFLKILNYKNLDVKTEIYYGIKLTLLFT